MTNTFDAQTLIHRLGAVHHFRSLSLSDLRTIVTSGHVFHYPAGAEIFHEGEPCAGLHVLFKGLVHLCKNGPQGQLVIVGEIEPVIMFNEVAVLDGGPNPITATAVGDCTTWNIGYERFQNLMSRYPVLGLGLLKVLARRTRGLLEHCEDISFRSVIGRTAKVLLDLSENGCKPIDRREHSNQEIAAKVASVPEPISRAMKVLRQEEIICCTRTRIVIRAPERLAKLAGVEDGQTIRLDWQKTGWVPRS